MLPDSPRNSYLTIDPTGGSHRKGKIGRPIQEVKKINNCGAEGYFDTPDGRSEPICGSTTDGQCLKKDWGATLTKGECALEK